MRLFIAISLSPEIRNDFSVLLHKLGPLAPLVKFVRAENLHLTLKFLGEVSPVKLDAVCTTLSTIRSSRPMTLEFRSLGLFPNESHPRVLWGGVESSSNLKSLAADIDHAMHKLGFPLENRAFLPHLTLARFYKPGLPPKLGATVIENSSRSFGSLTATEIHLIQSKLKPSGAEYTILQSFPFVAT